MGQVYVDENSLSSIGNAIRNITGTANNFYPNQMGPTIENISTGPEITDASYLFYGGVRWNIKDELLSLLNNITNMHSMFESSVWLYASNVPDINTDLVTDITNIFSKCTRLNSVPNYNYSSVYFASNAFAFTDIDNINNAIFTPDNIYTANFDNIFKFCNNLISVNNFKIISNVPMNASGMFDNCRNLSSVDSLFITANSSHLELRSMFENCINLSTINNLTLTNISNGYLLFRECRNLSSFTNSTISLQDNSSAYFLFSGCTNLTNMPSVTGNNINAYGMFISSGITDDGINLENISFSNMHTMFSGCKNLVDLSNLNINMGITNNIANMFCNSENLVNAPTLDTNNVTNIAYMFCNCINLVNVPQYNTSNVKSMERTFWYCNNLSNESIQNIVNMCLNSNITASYYKNLSNVSSYSPLLQTKFDNSYYQNRWQELTDAGWTY